MLNTGNIALSVEPCGGGQRDIGTFLPPNEWHHFAMVVDRDDLGRPVDAVVPGRPPRRLQSLQPLSGARRRSTTTVGDSAYIGVALNNTGLIAFFDGMLDEFRIWDHVRTETQLQDNMNSEIPSAAGLRHRWAMNEGTGLTAADPVGAADGDVDQRCGLGEREPPGPRWQTSVTTPPDPTADGLTCDDGDICTGTDVCGSGRLLGQPDRRLLHDGRRM